MTNDKIAELTARASIAAQYRKQLAHVTKAKSETQMIDEAATGAADKLLSVSTGSLVIYGDPQSGKTEMMICLTALLLDNGHTTIVHLMNDSVDLLTQNLDRFKLAGLAPAPRNATDLSNSPLVPGLASILFCKKNAKDLEKLAEALKVAQRVIVIDDEADYATPNGKINKQEKTRINQLVSDLLGTQGTYIGVTATPARLNLNNTFDNKPEMWVHFRPHSAYTGQDTFFPQDEAPQYRLTQLSGTGTEAEVHAALARFLVSVAYLNTTALTNNAEEDNYTFLIHTSGKTNDHKIDRARVEGAMTALIGRDGPAFHGFVKLIYEQSKILYPRSDPDRLTAYVIANASRSAFVVLNSKRDRASAGEKPTVPTCPFTIIIGGNIVSRGVTFPNLLSMFFTRDVTTKLQQDTYIQRARMFGARGRYLEHFELTIPASLYADWHRCFVFHRLALEAIKNNKISPVWLGDSRISVAASSSIDHGTVDLNKGEMSFQIFECPDPAQLDMIIESEPTSTSTLTRLRDKIGDAMPLYLIKYIAAALKPIPGGTEARGGTLAIHGCSSIAGYKSSADHDTVSRKKGFIGKPQLEAGRFPAAVHHVKIFYNAMGKARVFYKNTAGVQFVSNTGK